MPSMAEQNRTTERSFRKAVSAWSCRLLGKRQISKVPVDHESISEPISSGHKPISWDPTSHHPLGGGSYAFKDRYAEYIYSLLPFKECRTEINVMLQPNSGAHIGTLCFIILGFVVANRLKALGVDAFVMCDMLDQAKGSSQVVDGVQYQQSLRTTQILFKYLPGYTELLEYLSKRYDVSYQIRFEREFFSQPGMAPIIVEMVKDRTNLARCLSPSSDGTLVVRAPCPVCGLVDKYGSRNEYDDAAKTITFVCPHHGTFTIDIMSEVEKLQYNAQTSNIAMFRYYETVVNYNFVEICGSDYAGFWQEQLLWRHITKPALIIYVPLITDWSGGKISKSLYLQPGAYDYLKADGLEYMLNYEVFRQEGRSLAPLCNEIELWVDEPYRLFRCYTIHYMKLVFEGQTPGLGVIHKKS